MAPESPRVNLFTSRFAGMWVFAFVTFFSAFQLLPAIPFRILELGGTKAQAGWFLAIYTFASAFAAPLMGTIADHVGRRRLLFLATILFIVFSIAYGVITWLPLLLIVGLIHGAIWSAILSSSSAIMSELIPVSRRTEGLAYWGLASTAAIAIAPAAGLWVYHFGWTVLCVELAIISAFLTIYVTRLPAYDAARPELLLPSVRDAWDWGVIKTTLSLGVVAIGYGGVTSYVAIYSVERGIEPKSLYFSVFAATIVLVRVFTSHLGDRLGPKPVLYPSFAAIPIAFAVLAVTHERWQLITSGILFGIGLGGSYPALANFILSNTDPRRRARTFGSIVLAFDTGIGIGSLLMGAIGQRYGLAKAFGVAAGLSCLAIPIFMAASRSLAKGSLANGTGVASTAEHA